MSVLGNFLGTPDHIGSYYDYIGGYQGQPIVEIPNAGRDDLAAYFAELEFTRGVEIGTERGLYAEVLCQANPALYLDCVDPYRAYRGYQEHKTQSKLDAFFDEANHRLHNYHATFIRQFSVEASALYDRESLDFVYIDGNHTLLHVIQDLWYWVPKVRKGGIVAGHDYRRRKKSDRYKVHVVEAVSAYTAALYIRPLFILGTKEKMDGQVRDDPRSWMFIKE